MKRRPNRFGVVLMILGGLVLSLAGVAGAEGVGEPEISGPEPEGTVLVCHLWDGDPFDAWKVREVPADQAKFLVDVHGATIVTDAAQCPGNELVTICVDTGNGKTLVAVEPWDANWYLSNGSAKLPVNGSCAGGDQGTSGGTKPTPQPETSGPNPTPTPTPQVPTSTPTPTPTPERPTSTPTPTPTPEQPTSTPTPTPEEPTSTPTPTPEEPTSTPTPGQPTPTPTAEVKGVTELAETGLGNGGLAIAGLALILLGGGMVLAPRLVGTED